MINSNQCTFVHLMINFTLNSLLDVPSLIPSPFAFRLHAFRVGTLIRDIRALPNFQKHLRQKLKINNVVPSHFTALII